MPGLVLLWSGDHRDAPDRVGHRQCLGTTVQTPNIDPNSRSSRICLDGGWVHGHSGEKAGLQGAGSQAPAPHARATQPWTEAA